jgi:hypothetical protein
MLCKRFNSNFPPQLLRVVSPTTGRRESDKKIAKYAYKWSECKQKGLIAWKYLRNTSVTVSPGEKKRSSPIVALMGYEKFAFCMNLLQMVRSYSDGTTASEQYIGWFINISDL